MMAKISKGKGFSGCVKYILDPKKDTKLLDAQGVRLKSQSSTIESFITQAKLNPNLSKTVGHISLNFSVQDNGKLSNELMIRVAREYMQKMGIKNTQYIVARHFDKEHPHIHLCFNRVSNSGATISDQNDRYRSEKICKELTKKYGLYIASGKEQVKEHRLKEPDKTKYDIYHAIKEAIPGSKNWNELGDILKQQGIETRFKYRGQTDVIQGVIFSKNGYSFNGSQVDRMFSYSKIDTALNESKLSIENTKQDILSGSTEQGGFTGIVESIIAGIGSASFFESSPQGDDYEEEQFRKLTEYEQKKRKRKNKFRRKL